LSNLRGLVWLRSASHQKICVKSEKRAQAWKMRSGIRHLPSNLTCAFTWVCLRPFGALIRAALRASFRLTSRDRTLYGKTLTLHRAVVDAIEAGHGDRAEATMLAVLAQTSRDIATQTKAAMENKANGKTQKGFSELE